MQKLEQIKVLFVAGFGPIVRRHPGIHFCPDPDSVPLTKSPADERRMQARWMLGRALAGVERGGLRREKLSYRPQLISKICSMSLVSLNLLWAGYTYGA